MSSEVITRNDLLAILTEAGIPDDGMQEQINDIQEQINDILENLSVKTFDYTDFTYATNFVPYSTAGGENTPFAAKTGRIVNISGAYKNTANVSSVVIGKVPDGCEPLEDQRRIQQGSGVNRYLLTIRTNGEMTFARYGTTSDSTVPANSWLNIDCTYVSKS